MALVTDALPYVGGGSVGFLLFILGLFITKKLPSPMERELLLMELKRANERLDNKDDYIKKLVQELSDTADKVRVDVIPSLSSILNTLIRVEQEIMIRRNNVQQ